MLLSIKSLQKRGWREIATLAWKVILALFVIHANPIVLLGGMYLKLFLKFNFYFSYFLGLSAYGAWMMLQSFIFKRLHVNIKYFMKVKWRSVPVVLISFFPLVCCFGLVVFHSLESGFRNDGDFEALLFFFVAIPLFVILSFLCFIYQTYCLVRSRKRPLPFFLGA